MGSEVDLSCSESSADFSEDLDTPEVSAQPQDSLILEFRRVDPEDARVELDRLRLVETASMAPAGYLQATEAFQRERSMIVDSICGGAERLNFNFLTSALAVNILDRFLAASCNVHSWFLMVAAVACLFIAGKLEGSLHPCCNFEVLHAMFPGERCELHDLTRMELTILSVLSWRTLGVTSVNLVDPLISLLDLQHPALQAAGGLEMACTIREGCKLAIARSLREINFLVFRPSSIAAAAVFSVLEELSQPVDLTGIAQPLRQHFCLEQMQEIRACCAKLQPLLADFALGAVFKNCRMEVSEREGLVRVLRPAAGSWTPTSVLQVADGAIRGRDPRLSFPAGDLPGQPLLVSSYADWQLIRQKTAGDLEGSLMTGYE